MLPEEAWSLVPDRPPPDMPPWIERFAGASKFSRREFLSYAWAMRLIEIANVIALPGDRVGQPRYVDVSAGFIPIDATEEGPRTSPRAAQAQILKPRLRIGDIAYVFGVVAGVDRQWFASNTPVDIPSLSAGPDALPFPLIVEPRVVYLDSPPDPVGAKASCFVTPQINKRFFGPTWNAGIVIARHSLQNLGFNLGAQVSMTNGQAYPVCDIDASTNIDAAIVDCGTLPAGTTSLPITPALAPGSTVHLHLNAGVTNGSVLRVHDHPHYYGNLIAHRVFTDTHGQLHDSGSLVTDATTGHAAGTYIGHTNIPQEGFVQSFRQISKYFEVDLHI